MGRRVATVLAEALTGQAPGAVACTGAERAGRPAALAAATALGDGLR